MGRAWIDGSPVALEAAAAAAARLLSASRLPVIAGLGTDVAGARAAVMLAQRIGGAVDHMHSAAQLNDLEVMREGGMVLTTPNEARLRADTLLVVGTALADAPELARHLLSRPAAPEASATTPRRVLCLCPGDSRASLPSGAAETRVVGRRTHELPALLAALRARIAGRPVGKVPVALKALDSVAADLEAARFGVAIWSAAELDALAIAMLCGLIDDLNARTRFAGIPLLPGDNAAGVSQACAWLTGYPVRVAFSRGPAEHDPWRFDARRLIDSGEADCALWISAYGAAAPTWKRNVPLIALTGTDAGFRQPPRVHVEVGRPGVDHDAVEHLTSVDTLAPRLATAASDAVPVAQVLGRIAAALPERSPPC